MKVMHISKEEVITLARLVMKNNDLDDSDTEFVSKFILEACVTFGMVWRPEYNKFSIPR